VHTDIGHRCRGAKVDGALVPLNTQAGHRAACRDHSRQARWTVARLAQPSLAYLFTHRSRLKVRQWFASLALEDTLAEGRAVVLRELQRMGHPASTSTILRPAGLCP
jgi:GTP pyrophosphokinase